MAKVEITIRVNDDERRDIFEAHGKPEAIRGVIEARAGELYHKLDPGAAYAESVPGKVTKPARGGRRKTKDG